MKASLTFDLDTQFEKEAHLRCVKALDIALCLYAINEELHSTLKHCDDDKVAEAVQKLYTFLGDTMSARGVFLDDLIS